jgi:hypothetical protein
MKIKRNNKELTDTQIQEAFSSNGLTLTPILLDFEKRFSGLIIPIGLVEIEFGIIWGGGNPFDPRRAIIEFEENGNEESAYLIQCAKSQYPMQFALDENGRYYEDYELKFNSYEEMITAYNFEI